MSTVVCFVCNAENPTDARNTCESCISDSIQNFNVSGVLDLDTDIYTSFDKYADPVFKTKQELVDFVKNQMRTPEQCRADIISLCRSSTDTPYELFRQIRNLCDIGANNMSEKKITDWNIEEDEFNPWVTHQFSVTNLYTDGDKKYAVFVDVE